MRNSGDEALFELERDRKIGVLPESAAIYYGYLLKRVPPNRLLTMMEIFRLTKCPALDTELRKRGYTPLYLCSRKSHSTLLNFLNTIWRAGLIQKYARGKYSRTGRYYGIKWLIPLKSTEQMLDVHFQDRWEKLLEGDYYGF